MFGAWSAWLVKCSSSQKEPSFSLRRSECISSSNCSRSFARDEMRDVAYFLDSKSYWLDLFSDCLNWTTCPLKCFSVRCRLGLLLRLDLDLDLWDFSVYKVCSLLLPLESLRLASFVSFVLLTYYSCFLMGITRLVVTLDMFSFCCDLIKLLCYCESMYSMLL